MLKEIEQRQSIRKYLNKPVEPEKILELLKARRQPVIHKNGNLKLLQILKH